PKLRIKSDMARSLKKIAVVIIVLIVLLLPILISATIGWRPILGPRTRPLSDRRFESTPARLARGKYLANSVTGCFAWHSPADYTIPGAPAIQAKLGAGQRWPDKQMPWLVIPNITPDKETGIGNWTDDALARAIREGIGNDGSVLFPVMPYQNFRQMSD